MSCRRWVVPGRAVVEDGGAAMTTHPKGRRLYLSPPHMGGDERGFVSDAFDTNWLAPIGPNVSGFEAEMEARVGRACVALSSGTAAIHLALRLIGLQPGQIVICPTLTFVGSCNPALYEGGVPVFVDSERESWNMDPGILDEALRDCASRGESVGAVVVVHLFGQTAQMKEISAVCERYEVPIVEDAAEALGATYGGCPAGALAPFGVFSFNGNKIITTTSGGMLVTEDRDAADRARYLGSQARLPGPSYRHSEVGYNYRMSNVLAGIGRGQLRVLDDRVAARRAHMAAYEKAFTDLPMEAMPEASHGTHTRWLSVFLLEESGTRDRIIDALAADDIEARPVWRPMHLQELFAGARCYGGSVSEDLFERGICLPSGSAMSEADRDRVIAVVRSILT